MLTSDDERDGLMLKKQRPAKFAATRDPYKQGNHFATTFGKDRTLTSKQKSGVLSSEASNNKSAQRQKSTAKLQPQRITFGQSQTTMFKSVQNFKIEHFVFDKQLEPDMPPQRQVMLLFDDSAQDDHQIEPVSNSVLMGSVQPIFKSYHQLPAMQPNLFENSLKIFSQKEETPRNKAPVQKSRSPTKIKSAQGLNKFGRQARITKKALVVDDRHSSLFSDSNPGSANLGSAVKTPIKTSKKIAAAHINRTEKNVMQNRPQSASHNQHRRLKTIKNIVDQPIVAPFDPKKLSEQQVNQKLINQTLKNMNNYMSSANETSDSEVFMLNSSTAQKRRLQSAHKRNGTVDNNIKRTAGKSPYSHAKQKQKVELTEDDLILFQQFKQLVSTHQKQKTSKMSAFDF